MDTYSDGYADGYEEGILSGEHDSAFEIRRLREENEKLKKELETAMAVAAFLHAASPNIGNGE